MTRKALIPYDTGWEPLVLLALALVLWPVSGASAAEEPDLIFRRSTVFKLLSPNDKLATYGVDDPEVEGVACHFTVPEKGGFNGLARAFRASLGYFTGMPPDRPDPFQGQAGAGRRHVPPAPLLFFKKCRSSAAATPSGTCWFIWSIPTS